MQEQIRTMVEQLVATGKADEKLLELVSKATSDPEAMEELVAQLQAIAGDIEEPLNIEDFYTEGDGTRYSLRWNLSANNPFTNSGISFEALDRKTQFFMLFAEWQNRETEGMMSLTNGQLQDAETAFHECVERADQLNVDELRARSYEGLMRVAEKRDDPDDTLKWLDKIEEIRGGA